MPNPTRRPAPKPPPPPPPPAGWLGYLQAVLTWLNSPWKALALMGMVPWFVLAGVLWDERLTLVRVLTAEGATWSIDRDAAPTVLRRLLRSTGASAVTLMEMEPEKNRRRTVMAFRRGGETGVQVIEIEGDDRPIITSSTVAPIILPSLLIGSVPCVSAQWQGVPPDMRRINDTTNTVVYCVGGVPGLVGVLVGAVTAHFDHAPDDRAAVELALRAAGADLARYGRPPATATR